MSKYTTPTPTQRGHCDACAGDLLRGRTVYAVIQGEMVELCSTICLDRLRGAWGPTRMLSAPREAHSPLPDVIRHEIWQPMQYLPATQYPAHSHPAAVQPKPLRRHTVMAGLGLVSGLTSLAITLWRLFL